MLDVLAPSELLAELACPRCGEAKLELRSDAAYCPVCEESFPFFGTVPCLVEDGPRFRALWLSRLDDYREVTEMRLAHLRSELDQPGLMPRTRERLTRIIQAKTREIETLPELFEIMMRGPLFTGDGVVPPRPESTTRLAVLECYENVFRDWGWGGAESARLVALVEPLVTAPERVAIYGAGAGRFAADVHRALHAKRTFALDINPLPLFIAERLIRGEPIDLAEFPVSPTSDRQAVVQHRLVCPEAPGPGFQLLLANALRPPFAPESLDVVVAPWFVDVCGADLRETLAGVNRVLRASGTYVQLGPLDFNQVASRAYSFEEALEITQASGFEIVTSSRHELPYFDSPHSGTHRVESVYLICGKKRASVQLAERTSSVAAWLENPRLPIPRTPELAVVERTSMFTSIVIGLVDGTRSIVDIARELSATIGVSPESLTEELRAFMTKLPLA